MVGSIARDLVLGTVAQDIQQITNLSEAVCRRAVYTATDTVFAPAAFTEATERLLAGVREQDTTHPIVVAFWKEVADLSGEQGRDERAQPAPGNA